MISWDLIEQSGLSAKPITEVPQQWDYVIKNAYYVPVYYSSAMVDYQSTFIREFSERFYDLSMVIYDDIKPVAVWPLCLRLCNGTWIIGSNEGTVIPPLFISQYSEKKTKYLIRTCTKVLENLCSLANLDGWIGNTALRDKGLGLWHPIIMEKGIINGVKHQLYVDLTLELNTIKANFRKSYKALISKGLRLWRITIHSGYVSNQDFLRFKNLHYQMAGRNTRSDHTWALQQKAIYNNDAFLISIEDNKGVMVGCSLFYNTKDEGVYAVGVYDRALFDEPLGHVVQMKAIEHMKSTGLKWYKIGYRPYPSDIIKPSAKELNIGLFKEGFATHMFLDIETYCTING